MISLSEASQSIAGMLLVSIVAVEFGGFFVLRVTRGRTPTTDLQRAFFRAGHAHAGVLITLALVSQLFVDAAELTGLAEAIARHGVAFAAVLVSAGYFMFRCPSGCDEAEPIVLARSCWSGEPHCGVVTLGTGLIVST